MASSPFRRAQQIRERIQANLAVLSGSEGARDPTVCVIEADLDELLELIRAAEHEDPHLVELFCKEDFAVLVRNLLEFLLRLL
jgi:hypothetical protein